MTVALKQKQVLTRCEKRQPPLNVTERKGTHLAFARSVVPVSYFAALVRGGWLAARPVSDGFAVTGRCPSATPPQHSKQHPRPRRSLWWFPTPTRCPSPPTSTPAHSWSAITTTLVHNPRWAPHRQASWSPPPNTATPNPWPQRSPTPRHQRCGCGNVHGGW